MCVCLCVYTHAHVPVCSLEILTIYAVPLAIITEHVISITFQPYFTWFLNPLIGKFAPL